MVTIQTPRTDVVVVGAGLIGLATARSLLASDPTRSVVVVDKEPMLGAHQSSHNSGVIHSGLYYAPGSAKAKMCTEGRQALIQYVKERGIAHDICGKLVVAIDESEFGRFDALAARGQANGIELREVPIGEVLEREPNLTTARRAVLVPGTGVIDFAAVVAAYAADVRAAGGSIQLDCEYFGAVRTGNRWRVETSRGEIETQLLVTCGGLHADLLSGQPSDGYQIVPFRGDYYTMKGPSGDLVRSLIYPVPDPSLPFLGVHFTRGIDGAVHAGPNAVLALAREGYRRRDVDLRELWATVKTPGFRRLARRYMSTGAQEMWRDIWKRAFTGNLQRYIPAIEADDLVFGPSGVRAQCISAADGSLVEDFAISCAVGRVDVINAPSPAATASIAIGDHIAKLAVEMSHI